MKIVLAGTPFFSVPTFEKIIQNFDVVAIISQPNRPSGRGMIITPTPTSILASKYNIQLFQPEKIQDIEQTLKTLDYDVLITMAYGQIIPEQILNIAKKGSYNIHASLLPKYRGSSPIHYAIWNGEKETGITFMEMVKKMDAGDMLFQASVKIEDDDNYDSMSEKLSNLAQNNIVNWLEKISQDDFVKTSQDENQVSFAHKLTKEDEKLGFDTSAKMIQKINAFSSIPGVYLNYELNNGNVQRLKVFKVKKEKVANSLEIKTKDDSIYAIDYQFEGKRRVKI